MIKSYCCLIYGLQAFPGRLFLIFSIITCHLVKVEVSIMQKNDIPIVIYGMCNFFSGAGPVWVSDELRFVVVPVYLLFMPLAPDVGPFRVNVYLGFNKFADNCYNKIY